jgi:hypothetical protein
MEKVKRQFKTKPTGRPKKGVVVSQEERDQHKKDYQNNYRKTTGKGRVWGKNFYERHKNDEEFRERYNKYSRDWWERQTPERKRELMDRQNEKQKQKSRLDPRPSLFHEAKKRAKKRGLEFNISIEDVIIPPTCPVLGIPLYKGEGKQIDNSPTIDRIDNSKGYTKDNIKVISYRANSLKNNGGIREFELLIKYLENHGMVR